MMHISIWQQWASNHSSYFTVIGEFQSVQQAQEAGEKLEAFFNAIDNWFELPENADANEERIETDTAPVSTPENEWAERFKITWYEYSIDWLYPGYQGLFVVDNLVFIQPGESWQGGGQLAAILSNLGGKGMVNGSVNGFDTELYHLIDLTISCSAPSPETAQTITDIVSQHTKAIKAYWQALHSSSSSYIPQPEAPWASYTNEKYDASNLTPEIHVHEVQLQTTILGDHLTGNKIPPFVAWLKVQGCTAFEYRLVETVDTEDE